jgi:hypothetical protein
MGKSRMEAAAWHIARAQEKMVDLSELLRGQTYKAFREKHLQTLETGKGAISFYLRIRQ